MIQITKYKGYWRLNIIEETWEFEDLKKLQDKLELILSVKQSYGDLHDFKTRRTS